MDFPQKWLQSDSLGELISNELRLQIINGTIPRDTVLTESQISNKFDTSRSPVREAFKILETEGLIHLKRMGAVVLGLEEKDIKELYDVRFLLEKFCMQILLEDFDEEKANEFYRLIDLMELNMKHNDYSEFAYHDLLFHEMFILSVSHKRILHLWKNIRNIVLCLLFVATEKRFLEDKGEIENLLRKHRAIIDALVEKNENQLNSLMEEHFNDTKVTVMNAYLREIKS
ncbi:GntR family transcriptional regulator [Bacillus sp. OK048]|uniref:GntR family transcriptional regulator n=1 Tax=Bacillus sp. OK048 TaxID=1882761 RepID=UPI000885DD62|nr:GntR family transcriptional regulator [Bacillus sp. OK048]SDN71233.1 GntR family transcriptional regulator, gluconate operon transcriptional repressor [Bacillus sp. OK048]